MSDTSKLKIGDKVHYVPFEGCEKNQIENGIVKEFPEHTNTAIRVVYNCAGEWNRFMDYTSALTQLRDLGIGWKHI